MADQQLVLFPLAFWALTNDTYSVAQTKRLFPLIAAGGVIGSILGNGLAAGSVSLFAPRGLGSYELLVANSLLMLVAYLVFSVASRNLKLSPRQDTTMPHVRDTIKEGWDFVANVEAFRYLALAMLGVGFAMTVIEFRFLEVSFQEVTQFQTFYGLFRIGQTLLTLVVQGFLAGRLIERVGLRSVFLVLPAVCLSVISGVLALPGLVSIVVARLLGRVGMYAVDEPARKSLQGLIPIERRGRVSAFLDGYLYAVGTIVACLLMAGLMGAEALGWLHSQVTVRIYLGLGAVILIGAIVSAWRLRATYDTSMLNWRLARRQRRSFSLDIDF
jgi:hypothetical protein